MARRPSEAPSTEGAIIANTIYEIDVKVPFEFLRVQFIPARDRVYRVKGKVLMEIQDKVKEYRPVS